MFNVLFGILFSFRFWFGLMFRGGAEGYPFNG
jgi:hypothetical protein